MSSTPKAALFDEKATANALRLLAEDIRNAQLFHLAIVGIRTGGAVVARALYEALADLQPDLGLLDITLYRDDTLSLGANARLLGTDIPFDVSGRSLLLVDDVLFTGRTVRAAMSAICDLGRPRRIYLATLVDRGGRELPIAADFVGFRTSVPDDQRVSLRVKNDVPVEVFLEPSSAAATAF